MRRELIVEKRLKLRQKINLKEFLSQSDLDLDLDLDLDEMTLFYSPHSAEILKMIAEMKNEKFNFQTHGARLDQQVIKKFLLSYQEDEHFYLVLPNVALGQEYYETSMPVLMIEKNKLNIILSKMSMDNIDFISIFTTDFKTGILIDGYSDFPCEKNNHQDGQVYDYYFIGEPK